MKKSSLFFIASILGLASLTGVASLTSSDGNSIQGARATGVIEDGKYFILNSDGTKGVYRGDTSTPLVQDKANVSIPFDFVRNGDYYNITYTKGNLTYTFCSSGGGASYLVTSVGSKQANWTITEVDGKYRLQVRVSNEDYSVFINDNNQVYTKSDAVTYLTLIPVSSFISGMATIPCEGYTDTDEKSEAWKSLGNSLDITVKNYLKGIECDKSASLSTIEGSLAKYDYVIAKYKDRERYPNFLDRTVKDIHYFDTYRIETKENNNSGYLLIGVVSISIVIMGITLINIRKKKEH